MQAEWVPSLEGELRLAHAAQPEKGDKLLPQQVVTLKRKRWDGFPAAQFYPAGVPDLCFFCNSIRTISNNTEGALQRLNQALCEPEPVMEKVTAVASPLDPSPWRGRGTGPSGDSAFPSPVSPPDEHVPAGEHRHAELHPSAPASRPTRCPRVQPASPLTQRLCGWPGSSDFEPQCHPLWRTTARSTAHGLAMPAAPSPRSPSLEPSRRPPPPPRQGHRGQRACVLLASPLPRRAAKVLLLGAPSPKINNRCDCTASEISSFRALNPTSHWWDLGSLLTLGFIVCSPNH